jgi:hypothetical protein
MFGNILKFHLQQFRSEQKVNNLIKNKISTISTVINIIVNYCHFKFYKTKKKNMYNIAITLFFTKIK